MSTATAAFRPALVASSAADSRASTGAGVTSIYEFPCITSRGLAIGSEAFDLWTGHQSRDAAEADHRFEDHDVRSARGRLRLDLHLYHPDRDLAAAEASRTYWCVVELLRHTTSEVHALPPRDRGHYLVQLATRWFSDGHIAWQRFRIANLLAAYYSMMPAEATHLGAFNTEDPGLTVFGWDTPRGEVLDVVRLSRGQDLRVEADVDYAMTVGRGRWPDSFTGVRYLPLEDLDTASFHDRFDGPERFVSRDDIDAP